MYFISLGLVCNLEILVIESHLTVTVIHLDRVETNFVEEGLGVPQGHEDPHADGPLHTGVQVHLVSCAADTEPPAWPQDSVNLPEGGLFVGSEIVKQNNTKH